MLKITPYGMILLTTVNDSLLNVTNEKELLQKHIMSNLE